jgi:hypothetical protein
MLPMPVPSPDVKSRGREANMDYSYLKHLSDSQLRTLKVRYATARGNSWEHKLFCAVDRVLTDREGVTHFKTGRVGDCIGFDPLLNPKGI